MIRETAFGEITRLPDGLLARAWLRLDDEDDILPPPFDRGWRMPGRPGLWAPQHQRIIPLRAAIAETVLSQNGTSTVQNNTIGINVGAADYLVVISHAFIGPSQSAPTSISYGGAGMTLLNRTTGGSGYADDNVGIYGRGSPSTGLNNLVLNYSSNPSTGGSEGAKIGWIGLSGVHQGVGDADSIRSSTPQDGAWGTSVSLDILDCETGDYGLLAVSDFDDTTHNAGTGMSERYDSVGSAGSSNITGALYTRTASSDGTLTVSCSGGSDMLGAAVALIPAGEASPGPTILARRRSSLICR